MKWREISRGGQLITREIIRASPVLFLKLVATPAISCLDEQLRPGGIDQKPAGEVARAPAPRFWSHSDPAVVWFGSGSTKADPINLNSTAKTRSTQRPQGRKDGIAVSEMFTCEVKVQLGL